MNRVFFLIRSLNVGGAERQLTELVKGLDKTRFAVTVATFYDGGALRQEIEGLPGVEVLSLQKKGRWDILSFLWRFLCAARKVKPHILHGYTGANQVSLLVGRMVGAKVVWGIRASNMDFARYERLSAWLFRLGGWLSRFPDLIIVNSHAGKQYHIAQGYHGNRMLVVPNGMDTERFRPDVEAGKRLRYEWGVAENAPLIGLVGRLDPMKDHPTFLKAAAILAKTCHDARFVCVGDGPDAYSEELRRLAATLGLGEHLIWAGARSDVSAVYNALDILASSSSGEGFSNVIGEAMACGTPVVTTDVGDSAFIVNAPERTVPPGNAEAMEAAWNCLLALPDGERAALSESVRERIVCEFSTQQLIRKTEAALLRLIP